MNDTDWPWSDTDSDYSDIEIDNDSNRTWCGDLREWALSNKVPHTAINALLKILHYYKITCVPKDARTLLKTPKKHVVCEISGGFYWHNGIKKNLELLYSGDRNKPKEIEILVNIDGLPISRSSNSQFWPIIGQIHKAFFDPFFIGIFHGYSKPKDTNEFLRPFIDELNDLLDGGVVIDGAHINVTFRCFLCDAPAKCLIKGTVYHNAYFACHFCCVEGQYDDNRMSYPEFNCQLRTNESFRNRVNEEHHKSATIVEELPIDMVDCFPNDYLHLILLGITKTKGKIWFYGSNYETKLSANQITIINNRLDKSAAFQPTNVFGRKIRTLEYFGRWKGTELRTWLLYVGPVVLKGILCPRAYNHFLALHCGVRICTSSLIDSHLIVAEALFKYYADEYIEIYGEQSISFNIHNIIHVAKDAKKFGNLDSFSCFPAENKLFILKNLLRKGDKPLAQSINRLSELELLHPKKNPASETMLKNERKEEKGVYEKLIYKDMCIDTSQQNKWFLTEGKEIVEFEKAFYLQGNIVISGSKLKRKSDFFETPLKSSFLDIYTSNGSKDSSQLFQLASIKTKIFAVTTDYCGMVFFPILHNY